MDEGDPIHQALPAQLMVYLAKLRKRLRRARAGDANGLRESRVALRRLRVGLGVLERTVGGHDGTMRLERGLHAIERSLSATRDEDVLLAHIDVYVGQRANGAGSIMGELRAAIRKRRKRELARLTRALERRRTRGLLRRLARLLRVAAVHPVATSGAGRARPVLVRHYRGQEIWRAYGELMAYDVALPVDLDTLHRIRAACRRLRYVIELFGDALGPSAAEIGGRLSTVQDRLGAMHDHHVAVGIVSTWAAKKRAPPGGIVEAYVRERIEERDRLRAEFATEWRSLMSADFQRAMAHALMGDAAPGADEDARPTESQP